MACFSVPLAAAVGACAIKKALPNEAKRNPFISKMNWLGKMMFGGSFLLAIEHIYHGEIIFAPPFLTAAKEGPKAISEMLHEMATRGTAMAILITAVWAAMVAISEFGKRKTKINV